MRAGSPACSSHPSGVLTATPQWPRVWPCSGTSSTSPSEPLVPGSAETADSPIHDSPAVVWVTHCGLCAHCTGR